MDSCRRWRRRWHRWNRGWYPYYNYGWGYPYYFGSRPQPEVVVVKKEEPAPAQAPTPAPEAPTNKMNIDPALLLTIGGLFILFMMTQRNQTRYL